MCNYINLGVFYNKIGLLDDSFDAFEKAINVLDKNKH